MEAFDQEIHYGVERGVLRQATAVDLPYEGPVNYFILIKAYKESESTITPVQVCLDAFRKKIGVSLNDILVQGPNKLACQISILLSFRFMGIGMTMDTRKFYQSVKLCEKEHFMHIPWSPDPDKPPDIYVGHTNHFGIKPAGPVASIALNMMADIHEEMYPEAAKIMKNYNDDLDAGGNNRPHTVDLEYGVTTIASHGSFSYKLAICSRNDVFPWSLWSWLKPKEDALLINCSVKMHKKIKGAKTAPDLVLLDVIIWQKFQSIVLPHKLKANTWLIPVKTCQLEILSKLEVPKLTVQVIP